MIFLYFTTIFLITENIAQIICNRHIDGKLTKIIFALNGGKSNGGTYVGNSVIDKQALSGCHFSWVFIAQNRMHYFTVSHEDGQCLTV